MTAWHVFVVDLTNAWSIEQSPQNILILDIDDQNVMYILASKGTRATYLNLNLQQQQSV